MYAISVVRFQRRSSQCIQGHAVSEVFYPLHWDGFAFHLYRLLRFEREDPSDVKLTKLEQGLQPYTLPIAEVVASIVTRADGVPLYVEELTKALLELILLQEQADAYIFTGPLAGVAILATLQDSLMEGPL